MSKSQQGGFMKRWELTLLFCLLFATIAEANIFTSVKDWFTGNVAAYILTGILAIGIVALWAGWISSLLISCGTLFITVGNAISDKKITNEELADIKQKIKDLREIASQKPKGK